MKKYISILSLFSVFLIFLNSCSLKIQEREKEFAKLSCEERFKEIVEFSQKPHTNAKVKGKLQTEGILLTFIGKIGNEGKINFYLPFGKKVLTLENNDENLCVEYEDKKLCNKERIFYRKVLEIDIPFKFKELISGRYKIDNNATYECKGDKVIVRMKDTELIYKYLKPQIVKYQNYKIEYVYRDDLLPKTITIYYNNKPRINIKILKVVKWIL